MSVTLVVICIVGAGVFAAVLALLCIAVAAPCDCQFCQQWRSERE